LLVLRGFLFGVYMSDNKKYYYLKLKDNFFDSEEIIILQNMQDGYLYSDILFKMYLRSLKNEGMLMFNNFIPYDANILSQIVRHSVGVVEKAIKLFQQLSLIEVMDNGAIYMLNIQNYIGNSSSEADRQREYQNRIKTHGLITCKKPNKETNSKTTPEIEIKIDKEIKREIKKKKLSYPSLEDVKIYFTEKQFIIDAVEFYNYFTESHWIDSKGNKVLNWKQKAITWNSFEKKNKNNQTKKSDPFEKYYV
jgi:predicted phage replisome organizer